MIASCLIFFFGQAKLAIYLSRKNFIEKKSGYEVTVLFSSLVKSRILVDFNFFKAVNGLFSFDLKWCSKGALCTVVGDDLFFNSMF